MLGMFYIIDQINAVKTACLVITGSPSLRAMENKMCKCKSELKIMHIKIGKRSICLFIY